VSTDEEQSTSTAAEVVAVKDPPRPFVKSINRHGVVLIGFTKKMIIPEDLSVFGTHGKQPNETSDSTMN